MAATTDLHEAIQLFRDIAREVQEVVAAGSAYTRDHIVPAIRSWVIILHQSFVISHGEAEPVLDMDPLVISMRSLVHIVNDSYAQLGSHREAEAEALLDVAPILLPMRSVLHIMSDSSPELHAEQRTVVDANVAVRATRWIYGLARSTYDIMSVLAG
ncbi:GL14598 [Drosophila persimilis]|uniref:GL14598 n=1 Tax=Drosophila persimilis TaxID=7234 RepID=B4GQ77_DROPE|nr:uncharacterized protein LOC6595722 [Drosophila persimilis]EDW39749.1 GL14598 [Drosophila persimilis]